MGQGFFSEMAYGLMAMVNGPPLSISHAIRHPIRHQPLAISH
jgi:hypothetical protein